MALSADDLFRSLPIAVTRLACTCENPSALGSILDKSKGFRMLGAGLNKPWCPWGSYCMDCGKPHKYSMSHKAVSGKCEGCDKTFSPDWRIDDEVRDFLKFGLCKECSNGLQPTIHRRRPKITGNYKVS